MLPLVPFLFATTAQSTAAPMQPQATPFDLREVRLLDSRFKEAMDLNAKYLLELDPDRFLHNFRKHAGLTPKGKIYGGWESMGVAGQTLGHYITALSQHYRATGNERFKMRINHIVRELAECQAKRKTGYVGGIPDEDRIWREVKNGDVRSQGFDLNGGWVPWYTLHKLFAGLLDAHKLAGNAQALEVLKGLGDWTVDLTANLDEDKWQRMLACEHGGMNESFAELYARTGDQRFLELSEKFRHRAILDPLAAQRDELAGKHANTQIPKVIGLARRYELTGDERERTTAEFFWDRIVNHHSYVIGGNSNHEHLGPPDALNDRLSASTAECCNTYNMLKLTRHLFAWSPKANYADFYERALYNQILASQNPKNGMFCYFMPLASGERRTHSDPENSFWCCVGSGIENHTKYADSIYFHSGREKLYVNLFIPSELNFADAKVKIKQETAYPNDGKVKLTVTEGGPADFGLALRHPAWAKEGMRILINGNELPPAKSPGNYITLQRTWQKGDVVELELPMRLYTEAMPDNPKRIALLYGPLVLAADLGPDPMLRTPVLVPGDRPVEAWVRPVEGAPTEFEITDAAKPGTLRLRPFNTIHENRYAVYFDKYTDAEWATAEEEFRAEETRLKDLEARTTDIFRVGEMQPERDHNLQGERTSAGDALGRKYRHADSGGWFSFEMAVDDTLPNQLVLTLWGSDGADRVFDVQIEGTTIYTHRLSAAHPNKFFDPAHDIPLELTKGKKKVTVRLQAHPGKMAGGLFGARMVKKPT